MKIMPESPGMQNINSLPNTVIGEKWQNINTFPRISLSCTTVLIFSKLPSPVRFRLPLHGLPPESEDRLPCGIPVLTSVQ